MHTASITLDPDARIAPVNPRLFGSFVEHMGRCVYTGIFEPEHPTADADGFRTDVLDLVRQLGVTLVRYPGGNFVSGYRWEDGVGPREQRPRRAELAWHGLETNQFGTDEFIRWCRRAGVEPMMAVNLGTRGVLAAADLVEYCNLPGGTALSEQRIRNGSPQPHDVRLWCLGNEMDGPWQLGHMSAQDYGRLAARTAHALRSLSPDLELVACGSSNWTMPTFGTWETTVLEETYDLVDMISCHAYYQVDDGDRRSFLASGAHMDRYIEAVVGQADAVGARRRSTKKINVTFDEWNVWNVHAYNGEATPTDWVPARRLIEDDYSVTDAVVVGGLLISLLRHGDRVAAACLAQLVNVIGPIRTEPGGPAWRQTTFYPFAHMATHARGEVLRVDPVVARHETRHGDVSLIDAVATHDRRTQQTSLFLVNRSLDEPVALDIDARAVGGTSIVEALSVADADLNAINSVTEPDRVTPARVKDAAVDGARITLTLPPVSWTLLRLGE